MIQGICINKQANDREREAEIEERERDRKREGEEERGRKGEIERDIYMVCKGYLGAHILFAWFFEGYLSKPYNSQHVIYQYLNIHATCITHSSSKYTSK